MSKLLDPTTSISPIDGRYWQTCSALSEFFSERALFRYRAAVEIEYFLSLVNVPAVRDSIARRLGTTAAAVDAEALRARYSQARFGDTEFESIKRRERVTNHDIKALEYWIKDEVVDAAGLSAVRELVHFGLTSQDINNTAVPMAVRDAVVSCVEPALVSLARRIRDMGVRWAAVPMLARTHGQPATPTRVGKELFVFAERLSVQLAMLRDVPIEAKFGGATGGLNAHAVAFPAVDWVSFADSFVASLPSLLAPPSSSRPLRRQRFTTQIEHYDTLCALFDAVKRVNVVLINLARDSWMYISEGYFVQSVSKDEVGSSAMPHKVNPIDFENAEGNLGVANALLSHFGEKLPISRLQRDLSDSTVLRNIGVALGHTLVAARSLERGLSKLSLDEARLSADLESNWAVVAEAIQTILRREGYPQPYEALKKLTRHTGGSGDEDHGSVSKDDIVVFIKSLEVSDAVKDELLKITPQSYVGILPKFDLPI